MSFDFAKCDLTKPLSDEDVVKMTEVFKSLPTFDGEKVNPSDIPEFIKRTNYSCTPEQTAFYQKYYEEKGDGKMTIKEFICSAKALHDPELMMITYVKLADKNGDGFIDADELPAIEEFVINHFPEYLEKRKRSTFEGFVKEADTNKDGKVSIKECEEWIKRIFAEYGF